MKILRKLFLLCMVLSLVGCGAARTAIQKKDLSVETKMSAAVVLEPLAPSERIAYVRVRDASGNGLRQSMLQTLSSQLGMEGIKITNNPKEANLMLHATILQAGKTTKEEAYSSLRAGFSGALAGAGTAAVLGASGYGIGGAALAGSAIAFLADTMVQDVYYSFVVDVELRERPIAGDKYANSADTVAQSGTSTTINSSVVRGENYKWIIYKTRIVTIANKVNLKFEEALPLVQKKTSYSIAECLL
ncbi:complement resistance protein TraT [Maridesulfovibrio salexigens]|uniref:TraT complement resistance family protein n=1 Tax=Maridesulfovibrio salexigens (strain ATCC 14822 / DSM 2638 / NCIMB 8403 / VKM B-1763) TaxID=526222 RepID=C6C086_MARSD|nr:complement resistance protein TraT [Maridesulfovibrio salexigens]ACS80957.1 TraT complement resistance family protein [Maridesulfovibrio salexigens DSM 2638]